MENNKICDDCPFFGVVYAFGKFVDYCKADGTAIHTQPVYCPFKPDNNGEEE